MTKDLYIKKSLTLWTKYFESKKHVCSILSLVTSFLLTLRFTKPRSFLMDTAAWYTAVGPMLFTPNFSTKRVSSAWRGSKWGSFQPGTNESLRRRGFKMQALSTQLHLVGWQKLWLAGWCKSFLSCKIRFLTSQDPSHSAAKPSHSIKKTQCGLRPSIYRKIEPQRALRMLNKLWYRNCYIYEGCCTSPPINYDWHVF